MGGSIYEVGSREINLSEVLLGKVKLSCYCYVYEVLRIRVWYGVIERMVICNLNFVIFVPGVYLVFLLVIIGKLIITGWAFQARYYYYLLLLFVEKTWKNWESPCIHDDSAKWEGEYGGGCQFQLTTDFSMHFDSSGELDPLSSSSGITLSVKGLQADLFQVPFSSSGRPEAQRPHQAEGTMTRHSNTFKEINALIAALSTPRIARTNSPWDELWRLQLITLSCLVRNPPFTLKNPVKSPCPKVRPVKELRSLGQARLTRIPICSKPRFQRSLALRSGSAPSNVLSACAGAK